MKIPFRDLIQIFRDHSQIWPADLVEDLREDDPHVYQQSQTYTNLLLQKNNPPPVFLPTLVVPGWNNMAIKGQKNWADFENLLFFYTLGKIQLDPLSGMASQKEKDFNDLRCAIEKFPILKGQKAETAEERVSKNTTYLAFGKNVIDSLLANNLGAQYDLYREIQDAEETNAFNGAKLRRSQTIANRVFNTLQARYSKNI